QGARSGSGLVSSVVGGSGRPTDRHGALAGRLRPVGVGRLVRRHGWHRGPLRQATLRRRGRPRPAGRLPPQEARPLSRVARVTRSKVIAVPLVESCNLQPPMRENDRVNDESAPPVRLVGRSTSAQGVLVAADLTFDRFGADNLDDPYPLYRRLRAEQPVFYSAEFDVWVVSRYDHVLRVLMDPTRFSSAFPVRTPAVPAPGVPTILAEGRPEVPALVNEDPPEHRRTRDLVAKAFSARRIAGLQPQVTELVSELLDGIEPRGRVDLVAEFARPLALRAICTLLGLPGWDV